MDIISVATDKMGKTTSVLKRDLGAIRAGRANPQVLDKIMVDYYGTPTPINQMGNISSPEARMLVISLWDVKLIPQVEKAIQKSDLGINPTNDGKLRRKGEEAKVAIRSIRRDSNEQIKKSKKDGEITEDDQRELEEEAQKLTDRYIKDIDKIIDEKEKEIMEV